jgi:O-antigen ligase
MRLMPDAVLHAPAPRLARALATGAAALGLVGAALWLGGLNAASPLLPLVVLVGVPGAVWLLRRPTASVVAALLGLALIVQTGEGVGVGEVLYALYYTAFLATWTVRHLLAGTRILETVVDKAVFLFLVGATLSVLWAPLYGTPLVAAVKEWYTLMMLAIYFPVRHLCAQDERAIPLLMGTLLAVALFVSLRNVLNYQAILAQAIYSYQVGRGRVIMNDCLLMASATMVLVWAAFAQAWRPRLVLLACYSVCLVALVVTQSRTFWVTHALAAGLLFALAPAAPRRRMLVGALAGALAIGVGGAVLVGENFGAIAFTMINRLLTIQQALGGDISFLSRLSESRGALQMIAFNPILGHGLATTFFYTDILGRVTASTSFVHIGYVGMWFTYGLWGLVLLLVAWLGALIGGLRAYFAQHTRAATRVAGLGSALILTVLLLSNFASPVFELDDTIFLMGLLFAFSSAAWYRARTSPSAST